MECLEKDPAKRPENAAILLERLRHCENAGRWTSRDAREWWASHYAGVTGTGETTEMSLSNTELIVDLDGRFTSGNG